MKTIICCLPILFFACLSCDTVRNKTIEKQCNSDTLEYLMGVDKSIAREYLCLCQQVAKGSDQNLCESIINSTNSKVEIETCKDDQACHRVFERRK